MPEIELGAFCTGFSIVLDTQQGMLLFLQVLSHTVFQTCPSHPLCRSQLTGSHSQTGDEKHGNATMQKAGINLHCQATEVQEEA